MKNDHASCMSGFKKLTQLPPSRLSTVFPTSILCVRKRIQGSKAKKLFGKIMTQTVKSAKPNLLELRASQMEKRTEMPIRRAGSPVACIRRLSFLPTQDNS